MESVSTSKASSPFTSAPSKLFYYASCSIYCLLIIWMLLMRSAELMSLVAYNTAGCFLVVLTFFGMISLYISPTNSLGYMLRRFALIALVVFQIKQALDGDLKVGLRFKILSDHVSIVTGANSGTGLAIAKQLLGLGSEVVMACRSEEKCAKAAAQIKLLYPKKTDLVHSMSLDLNDLQSVKAFTDAFQRRFKRLDILVNNAGMMVGEKAVSAAGLEQSFGAMHIGHFALTKWLLKLLIKPLPKSHHTTYAARVINVASEAAFMGNFHPSLMTGTGAGDLMGEITDNCGDMTGFFRGLACCPVSACPNTNGYARAKLANVLHAQELQRRVDLAVNNAAGNKEAKRFRRLVTASLHPGTVKTAIHGFLDSWLMGLISRSADDAAYVILHAILDDGFVPGSYIDGMKYPSDLQGYRWKHMERHLQSYPLAKDLPFASYVAPEKYDLHRSMWEHQAFIVPTAASAAKMNTSDDTTFNGLTLDNAATTAEFTPEKVAARLWDVSEQIVADWVQKKAPFSSVPVNDVKLKL